MNSEMENITKKAKAGSFQALGLDKELLKGLNRMGYKAPTPVQRKALPIVLAGMDCVCMARTGSGKTCVFLLPMIEKLLTHNSNVGVRGLVLSPTRELAKQTYKFAVDMAKFTNLRIVSICGGDPLEPQFEALSQRPDILIATPGRLMHHLQEISTFKLKNVQYLVFDEADRLFEMGFAEQLNAIVRECSQERQTLLFSATMPVQLVQFSRAGLRDPQLIRLETDTKLSEELRVAFFCVRTNEKVAALMYLVRSVIPNNQLTIIFTATKHHSEYLHLLFEKVGLRSTLVYGSMDQDARNMNLKLFRDGEVNFLIVTDLAARGLDVPLLNNVINFHFPSSPKLFVHRCGRAARQGRLGFAFSIVDPEEFAYMADVHTFIGKEISTGYPEAENNTPLSIQQQSSSTYTLTNMTPSMIHTGIFPPDILAEEADSLNAMMAESMDLQIYWRISENGMKQYRRTRPEATRTGIKIAKNISKSEGVKYIHPLIAGMDPKRCSQEVLDKAVFIKHLQSFRPAQTVFESGIGTGVSTGGTKTGAKRNSVESYGVQIMRALRKEVGPALERNRKNITSEDLLHDINRNQEHGSDDEMQDQSDDEEDNENDENNEDHDDDEEGDEDEIGDVDEFHLDEEANQELQLLQQQQREQQREHHHQLHQHQQQQHQQTDMESSEKRRMSKAERKQLKKTGTTGKSNPTQNQTQNDEDVFIEDAEEKRKKSQTFVDSKYYMKYGTEDEVATYVEDSLQPQSGLRSNETTNARMLENAMLDLTPDDALEMNKKKKMLRWDAKKRKFVKQSLEEMVQSKTGVKKIRTESGVVISKSNKPKGEIYENWKKKTRREITLPGTGDDDAENDRPRPNFKFNTHAPRELRNVHEIRTLHNKKNEDKLKNMKKEKRRVIEGKKRKQKADERKNGILGTKAGNRKVKAVWRK